MMLFGYLQRELDNLSDDVVISLAEELKLGPWHLSRISRWEANHLARETYEALALRASG